MNYYILFNPYYLSTLINRDYDHKPRSLKYQLQEIRRIYYEYYTRTRNPKWYLINKKENRIHMRMRPK